MKKLFTSVCLTLFLAVSLPVFAAETIKIGVQAPITGPYANEGQGIDQATRLIVEQYNAKGGLLGKKLEVITCDDEGTAVKAAICGKDLVSKGVLAVIGSYTSTAAEAPQVTYFRAGVLQTTDGTADSLTEKGYWTFFRNSNPNKVEAEFTANFLMNNKKYEKIALLSDYSTFAADLVGSVEKELKNKNGNIVYNGKIKSGTQNFTPVLTRIKSLNPDVVYFSGYYSDGGLIKAQMAQLGINADFVGGNANDNIDFSKLAGKAASGTMIINVPSPDLLPYDVAKQFLEDYKARFKMDPPSIWTLLNADGLRAILHGIEQTKSTDTKKIANYLRTMEPYPGLSGDLKWDEKGERIGSAYMAYEMDANGKYKVIFSE